MCVFPAISNWTGPSRELPLAPWAEAPEKSLSGTKRLVDFNFSKSSPYISWTHHEQELHYTFKLYYENNVKGIFLTSTVISSSNEDSDFFTINKKFRNTKNKYSLIKSNCKFETIITIFSYHYVFLGFQKKS